MKFFALACLLAGCGADSPAEPTVLLGGRAMHGYHLLANAGTSLPDATSGFLATADGHGTFHLDWIAAADGPTRFSGTASTDRGFDPNRTVALTGDEALQFATTSEIMFSGRPGLGLQGVSFAVENPGDPIYLDLSVDGTRGEAEVFFTGAHTRLIDESAFDPVAFTSP